MKSSTAVEELFRAHESGKKFDQFSSEVPPFDESEAYEYQAELLDRLLAAEGDEFSGYKIGSTTAVMQAYLGIANPCAGRLRAGRTYSRTAQMPAFDRGVLGVECEILVRLGAALPPRDTSYTSTDVASAISSCMVAIEVVEDRYFDWRSLDAPSLIADNFFHYAVVLGPEITDFDPNQLDSVSASMSIDGLEVGNGRGADVLGHPLNALAWIANHASARGPGLHADEIVLLGSLVETRWVHPGAHVRVENQQLGTVQIQFS